MSTCTISQRLGAYLDGELSPQETAAIQEHLATCVPCAAEFRELQGVSHFIGGLQAPAMSEASLRRLHASLDLARWHRLERVAGGLAALAACVAFVGIIWPARPSTAAVAPAPWEPAAVGISEDTAAGNSRETALAEWIVADLSTAGHGSGGQASGDHDHE